jgi:hypothetical protein
LLLIHNFVSVVQFTYPGVFKDKELLQFHRHLGEMSISPAYVERRAAEDWEDYQVSGVCFFHL